MQSVNELCEKGNSLSEVGMYQEALSCFKHALEKTPETYDYDDERVWILVAIGDTLFQLQQYSNAMEYLRRAYFYDPGNPFINLRLGQCELESDCILDTKEHRLYVGCSCAFCCLKERKIAYGKKENRFLSYHWNDFDSPSDCMY